MNKLYSLMCLGRAAAPQNYYYKRMSTVSVAPRYTPLLDALLGQCATTQVRAYKACMLCWLALNSMYADQVRALDSSNTYSKPLKQDSTDFGITMPTTAQLGAVFNLLDPDIRDTLASLSVVDYIGAAALQLLRKLE